jgi:valyl-tRNA synthetase
VVERELAAEGLTRHDLGREAFIEQVWEWKHQYGGTISAQMRRLGDSVDWTRERFTMDEGLSRAVREVFVSLFEDDLIYRGNRIINWCPRCHTALAEIEVEYSDRDGELAHLAYPASDGSMEVVVATTRAETMLGDVAVAVHPDDERYAHLVGTTLTLPLVGREIPVIADEHVDPEFGTGAVKVTPAHDPNDFEIGLRHGLEPVVIMDTEARINANGGRFEGLDRFEARAAVKDALRDVGALRSVEAYRHSVGHCYRCKTVVEPYLSDQWFVKVTPITVPAIEAVRSGESRFVPERWENTYFHWMENLRDWTISRQIWWGHRIPAWYCDDCGDDEGPAVFVSREDLTACPDCGGPVRQDPDVLDTWFSSALWPFSTLGWPDETPDLERFYPNQALVTGFDIIFFWVARMMQMGIHFMGRAPYPDIVIHGLIRDADGVKMSKSLGNALDPLEVIDEYGADPLRLALLMAAAPGHDVQIDPERIDGVRRFGNKVWNAARLVLSHVEPGSVPADGGYPDDPGPVDAWVLSRLAEMTETFDALAEEYRFADAYGQLYSFIWSEVFDWYLEMAKVGLRDDEVADTTRRTMGVVLRDILKLLHPAMPYLTEELWSHLVGDGLIAVAAWPTPPGRAVPDDVAPLTELVSAVRSFRAQHGLSPKGEIDVLVAGDVPAWWGPHLASLASVSVTAIDDDPGPGHTRLLVSDLDAFLALADLIDVDAERERLGKALDEARDDRERATRKLANPSFVERAPDDVVAKERSKRDEADQRIAGLEAQLAELG